MCSHSNPDCLTAPWAMQMPRVCFLGLRKTFIFSEKGKQEGKYLSHQSKDKNDQAFITLRTVLIAETKLLRRFQTPVGKSQGGCRGGLRMEGIPQWFQPYQPSPLLGELAGRGHLGRIFFRSWFDIFVFKSEIFLEG